MLVRVYIQHLSLVGLFRKARHVPEVALLDQRAQMVLLVLFNESSVKRKNLIITVMHQLHLVI